ncbi:MAG: nucleotide exchange factor GrpE [Verrucomicrobia bacterium]|nr:nucleotide exchange factor GrpE [Verrucomicrobiota bacterium]
MTASETSDPSKNNVAAASAEATAGQTPAVEAPTEQVPTAAKAEEAKAAPSLEQQLDEAKKAAAKNHDHYLRAMADLENFRRRTVREKDELRQFASGRVLEDLLPVIDNLTLGIAAAKAPTADLKNLVGGIEMVLGQLKTSLSGHGLKEINPVGEKFDPNQHEAIASQPSDTFADGLVLQVVRTGYSLNGRLLRPASIVVSSGSAKAEATA